MTKGKEPGKARMLHRLVVSVVLVMLPQAAAPAPVRGEPATVTIGVQLPLTGERAPIGRIIKGSVEAAIAQVNRGGGAGGYTLAGVFEDDLDARPGAVAALERLVSAHRVAAVIGELSSPLVMAGRALVLREKVPYLTAGTSPATTTDAPWIFRVGASDAVLADRLVHYLVEQRGASRLGIFHDRSGIHRARAEQLARVLETRHRLVPVATEAWAPGSRDFEAPLSRIGSAAPEVIVVFGEWTDAGSLLRHARALGLSERLVAHRDFATKGALVDAGDASEGVVVVTEYLPMLQDLERQAWAPVSYGEVNVAGQYFDAVFLLAEAVRRGGPTREGIRAGLAGLQGVRGVMAEYSFDADRNSVHRFYVARIEGRRLRLERILEGSR